DALASVGGASGVTGVTGPGAGVGTTVLTPPEMLAEVCNCGVAGSWALGAVVGDWADRDSFSVAGDWRATVWAPSLEMVVLSSTAWSRDMRATYTPATGAAPWPPSCEGWVATIWFRRPIVWPPAARWAGCSDQVWVMSV